VLLLINLKLKFNNKDHNAEAFVEVAHKHNHHAEDAANKAAANLKCVNNHKWSNKLYVVPDKSRLVTHARHAKCIQNCGQTNVFHALRINSHHQKVSVLHAHQVKKQTISENVLQFQLNVLQDKDKLETFVKTAHYINIFQLI